MINMILLLGLELSVVFRVFDMCFCLWIACCIRSDGLMNKFLQGPFAFKKTGSRLLRVVSLLFLSWGYACLSWPCGESRRQF